MNVTAGLVIIIVFAAIGLVALSTSQDVLHTTESRNARRIVATAFLSAALTGIIMMTLLVTMALPPLR